MMKKQLYLLIVFELVLFGCFGQGINQRFSFGRPNAVGASILFNGQDFIVSGLVTTDSFPQYAEALWAKIDTTETILSFKPYGMSGVDINTYNPSLILDNANCYVNAGDIEGDGIADIFLIKFDTAGNEMLFRKYVDSLAVFWGAFSLMQHSDKCYYLTGNLQFANNELGSVLFAKVDTANNLVFKEKFGTSWTESGFSLMELPNKHILIGAYRSNEANRQTYQPEWSHTWLIEVDTAGTFIREWLDTNDSTYYPTRMLLLSDSSFVYSTAYKGFQATDSSSDGVNYSGYFAKRDLNFNKIWEVKFNTEHGAFLSTPTFDTTSSGDFIVAQETYTLPVRGNYLITKISSSGSILWQKIYYPSDTFLYEVFPNSVKVLPNGNIAVWGEFRPGIAGIGRQQAWLLVLDSNGCLTAGCSTGWVEQDVVNEKIKLYPNPAHDNFYIDIENPQAQGGIVELYDINGRKILERKNNYSRQMQIDLSNYNTGIYFWRYTKESRPTQSGKIIKQ